MESIDDLFEYAMDLPELQRTALLARLRREEPETAVRLEQALTQTVRNPDFLCQVQAPRPAQPNGPDVLHHVTLAVGDVDKASRWYVEVFRCQLVRRDADRAVLAFGAVEVHLVHHDLEPPSLTLIRHDVAAMGPSERRQDGVRALRLVDPWGNAIEVVDGPVPRESD